MATKAMHDILWGQLYNIEGYKITFELFMGANIV
jgi:hypothetical protein